MMSKYYIAYNSLYPIDDIRTDGYAFSITSNKMIIGRAKTAISVFGESKLVYGVLSFTAHDISCNVSWIEANDDVEVTCYDQEIVNYRPLKYEINILAKRINQHKGSPSPVCALINNETKETSYFYEATFKSLIIMYDGNRTHNKAWIETNDDVEITKRLPTIEVL